MPGYQCLGLNMLSMMSANKALLPKLEFSKCLTHLPNLEDE